MANKNGFGESVWFLTRWYTGFAFDIFITIGAVLGSCWSLEKAFGINPLHELFGIPLWFLQNRFVAFCVAIGIFTAMMAGRQWARTQYYTHVLPEVWSDTVKNMIKRSQEELREDEKKEE